MGNSSVDICRAKANSGIFRREKKLLLTREFKVVQWRNLFAYCLSLDMWGKQHESYEDYNFFEPMFDVVVGAFPSRTDFTRERCWPCH